MGQHLIHSHGLFELISSIKHPELFGVNGINGLPILPFNYEACDESIPCCSENYQKGVIGQKNERIW